MNASRIPLPTAAADLQWRAGLCVLAAAALLLTLVHPWIGLGAMGVVCLLVFLTRPDAAVFVVLFLIYSNAVVVAVRFHGVPGPAALAVPLLLALPLGSRLLQPGGRIVVPPALGWALLFALVQIAGVLLARHKPDAVQTAITHWTEGLLLYVLVVNVVRTPGVLRGAMWSLVAAGAVMSLLTIYQQTTGAYANNFAGFAQAEEFGQEASYGDFVQPRSAGPIGEKNYFAQVLLMALPLAGCCALSERSWLLRALAALATVALAAAVALTFSRGGAMALAFVALAGAWMRGLRWPHLAASVLVLGLLVVALPQYQVRLLTFLELGNIRHGAAGIRQSDRAIQGRATEMAAAGLIFTRHPVLGIGPGMFRHHFVEESGALGFQVHARQRDAHCLYLHLAAENGAVGLLAFLGLLVTLMARLGKDCRSQAPMELRAACGALLLSLLAFAISAAFLSFNYVRYFWLIAALSAAASLLVRETRTDDGVPSAS